MVPQANLKTTRKQEGLSNRIKNTKLKIKDLLIPIVVAIILVFITIFVFVPMLKTAFEYRNELKTIKSKQEQLTKLKTTVEGISEEALSEDLIEVKTVIPRTLKVSSFLYYIDELARLKNLKSDSLSASDVNIGGSKKEEEEEISSYKGVNGPLAYEGTLEDVLSFLDNFYLSSPYIVSPRNIEMKLSADVWEVELSLTGYYISEDQDVTVNIYRPVKVYTEFPKILEILKDKAKKLNSPVKE